MRSAVKFSIKYWAAKFLQAKLFKSENAAQELQESVEGSVLGRYHKKRFGFFKMSTEDLQKLVRKHWCRVPVAFQNATQSDFLNSCVAPSLKVTPAECTSELRELSNAFAAKLAGGELDELAAVSARIAKASCSGRLAEHPALMGLVLQVINVMEKNDRGVGQQGPKKGSSQVERSMLEEAVSLLCVNGASRDLMNSFGFNSTPSAMRNRLDSLLPSGLPSPALALLDPNVLQENLHLINSLVPSRNGTNKHRFAIAIDSTYLLPMHQPIRIRGQRAIVGGPFSVADIGATSPNSFQPLAVAPDDECSFDLPKCKKANRMLHVRKLQGHL